LKAEEKECGRSTRCDLARFLLSLTAVFVVSSVLSCRFDRSQP
jgi:hypothetical protein